MTIREASESDIASLMTLERGAATAAHWTARQYETAISEKNPRRIVLIIEEDAGITGFLVARQIESDWEIENVAVASLARRRGLGSQLVREFLDRAREEAGEAAFLEVRDSNIAARALYEKNGFTLTGRRSAYYQDPQEDAILYRFTFT